MKEKPEDTMKLIETMNQLDKLGKAVSPSFNSMTFAPKPRQIKHRRRKIGRNELCPCGSGKKFKKCCWR